MQKGAWPLHLKKQEVQERQGKQKESARQTGVCCQEVKDITDFSGAAVKYLSSKGDGTDIRTMRSNAETLREFTSRGPIE